MNKSIALVTALLGISLFIPAAGPEKSSNRAHARPGDLRREHFALTMADRDDRAVFVVLRFDTLQGHDWYESRFAVTRMLNGLRVMSPKSEELKKGLRDYQEKEVIPYLVERLDFRETRRYELRNWNRWKSMFPVTETLMHLGPIVIEPLLDAVAKKRRSATYLNQARIALTYLCGGKEKFEKRIERRAKASPKAAARIRRLSHKHNLVPQMNREREYQQLLTSLEPKGMQIPGRSKENLKKLKMLEKLISSEKR